MPTQNPRINLTLDPQFMKILAKLAKRDHMSVAAKTKDLVLTALELDEDIYFSKLAEKREKGTQKWLSHEAFWG